MKFALSCLPRWGDMPQRTERSVIVIDGHLDLAMNALLWNRDLRQSAHEIRRQEAGMAEKGPGAGTVAFPELRRPHCGQSSDRDCAGES